MTRLDGDKTVNEGLCLVCAKELGLKPIDDLMKKFGISDEDLETFSEQFALPGGDEDEGDFETGGSPSFPNLFQGLLNSLQKNGSSPEIEGQNGKKAPENGGPKGKNPPPDRKLKYLPTYCDNLTAKARIGELDNIVGRDKEIYRTIQILSRRQKNNPCLIGEAGVGKTAIAEGIALQIVKGNVPSRMLDKEIYLLDLTSLVAGTQFRGQFESRVKGLVDEVKASGNVILFIDEIHNLTGAGNGGDGAMSAANLLKPALSRGEIQVIGATTFSEYRKFIEKDQALERRFQPVIVEEPSISDTVEIIKGIKNYYEDFHHVKVSDATVELLVTLSERYITDRFLPDKAIDLLDESAACCALASHELTEYLSLDQKKKDLQVQQDELFSAEEVNYEKVAINNSDILVAEQRMDELRPVVENLEVSAADLSKVIELWTGIPANKIQETEYKKVSGLKDAMLKRIIGQDEAVDAVASAIKRSRVGLNTRKRPASFIFVGPTGVGKTELVKVLATELFDSVDPLVRIDMSEYMEKYAVSRLIGSPPGYVGYDEAGQLTEKVRRKPYSVVLFDEIEKAHPDVLNILLQILDEGKITDGQGRTVNFENTVICMTSNAGSNLQSSFAGFGKTAEQTDSDKMLKALSDFLRPEFLSRVDEVIVFKQLSRDSLKKIAALMLDEIKGPLLEHYVLLEYNDKALSALVDLADGGKYGARDLRRVIRKKVEDPISAILIDSGGNPPKGISLTTVKNNDLVVKQKK